MKGPGRFAFPILMAFAVLFLVRILASFDDDLTEDFPFFAVVAAFIAFRFFAERSEERKRGPIPMPTPKTSAKEGQKNVGFKIPTLKGAPGAKAAEADEARRDEKDSEEALKRQSLKHPSNEKDTKERKRDEDRLRREHRKREINASENPGYSPETLRSAVIWAEVFAPPKAMRRRNGRWGR